MRRSLLPAVLSLSLLLSTLAAPAQRFDDAEVWTPVVIGTGPHLTLEDSQFTIDMPATSADDPAVGGFAGGLETACEISGDFDVRIEYQLPVWPAANGVRVGIVSANGAVERVSLSHSDFGGYPQGEVYLVDFFGINGVTYTTDLSGSLRIERAGSTVNGYYLTPQGWHLLWQGPSYTDAQRLRVIAWSASGLFPDMPVQVRLANFDVAHGEFPCFAAPDKTPPLITVAASPATLWPANGKRVTVRVVGMITDTEPGASGVKEGSATYVVMDEYGQIQPSGNLTLGADGSCAFTVALEASRRGNDQDGRHYTIAVSAQDNLGNSGTKLATVTVPHG